LNQRPKEEKPVTEVLMMARQEAMRVAEERKGKLSTGHRLGK
jgi:hypothetical protein